MKANETTLRRLLDGQQQYLIPLFQRPYSWEKAQWQTLWKDLSEVYGEDLSVQHQHFLGSVVTLSGDNTPEGVAQYLVIDGQQRLTTMCLLLAAIRDAGRESGSSEDKDTAGEIGEVYLTNHRRKGDARYKVLPTQVDRLAFKAAVDGSERPTARISAAYGFFRNRLSEGDGDGQPFDLARLTRTALDQLSLVSITLSRDDNPYTIFESLNAKGAPLSQADLVRNHFFMRLSRLGSDGLGDLYEQIWKPMQESLSEKQLVEAIWYYVLKDGAFVRQAEVYQALKTKLDRETHDEKVPDKMRELARFAAYYKAMTEPNATLEADPDVRRGLARIARWEITPAYSFLINVYADYKEGRTTAAEMLQVLEIIESYVVRRALCGVPTQGLNKTFLALYKQVEPERMSESLRETLLNFRGSQIWPDDRQLSTCLESRPLYDSFKLDRLRFVLERLEESLSGKERADVSTGMTVEHVMPQTLASQWREMLGDGADEVHARALHTLGNLTLTGYNSEMSNRPYAEKQERFNESPLRLNKHFQGVPVWNGQAIADRAGELAETAFNVWKR